jgi:hypothetical protein
MPNPQPAQPPLTLAQAVRLALSNPDRFARAADLVDRIWMLTRLRAFLQMENYPDRQPLIDELRVAILAAERSWPKPEPLDRAAKLLAQAMEKGWMRK